MYFINTINHFGVSIKVFDPVYVNRIKDIQISTYIAFSCNDLSMYYRYIVWHT